MSVFFYLKAFSKIVEVCKLHASVNDKSLALRKALVLVLDEEVLSSRRHAAQLFEERSLHSWFVFVRHDL